MAIREAILILAIKWMADYVARLLLNPTQFYSCFMELRFNQIWTVGNGGDSSFTCEDLKRWNTFQIGRT